MFFSGKSYARVGWLPVIGWCGFIFWMSSKSSVPEPSWLPPHADKMVHFVFYAVLSGLVYGWSRAMGRMPSRAAMIAIVAASLYGISDEWHQSFVAGRQSDFFDWMADTAGAMWVLLIVYRDNLLRAKS